MRKGSLIWFSLYNVSASHDVVLGYDDDIPRSILEHWIETSTVARSAMELTLDVREIANHILFVSLDKAELSRDGHEQLDWYNIRPRTASIIIPYVAHLRSSSSLSISGPSAPIWSVVEVLGYITWDKVNPLKGMVYVSDLSRGNNDTLLLPWELSQIADDDDQGIADMDFESYNPNYDEWCWYIPWCPSQTGSRAHPTVRGDTAAVTQDDIKRRMAWIEKCAQHYYNNTLKSGRKGLWEWWDTTPNLTHIACPSGLGPVQDMHAQVVIMQLVAICRMLWKTRDGIGNAFGRIVETIEEELWEWRLGRLCQSEASLYGLFGFNGFDMDALVHSSDNNEHIHTVRRTRAEDQHHFMDVHDGIFGIQHIKHGVSDLFFSVPYEEAPPPEEVDDPIYPLHPGGRAHLDWVGVAKWLWQRQLHFSNVTIVEWAYQHIVPFTLTSGEGSDMIVTVGVEKAIRELLNGQYRYFILNAKKIGTLWGKKLGMTRSSRTSSSSDSTHKSVHIPLDVPVQNIARISPPCIAQLFDQDVQGHPRYEQRKAMSLQLDAGKIPLEFADKIFTHMARLSPDIEDTADVDVARKWYNWDWTWKRDDDFRGRAPSCATYINNALKGADPIHNVCCPMVERLRNTPSFNDGSRHDSCTKLCTRQFIDEFPNQYNDTKTLKYPYQWYLWYLLRGGTLETTTE